MVLAFLFLAVSLAVGIRIERFARVGNDPWTRLAFAWGAGQVVLTWAAYAASWAFGFRPIVLIAAAAAAAAGLVLGTRREGARFLRETVSGSWRLSPARAFAVILVTGSIGLSLWQTGRGDLCVGGSNEDFSFHLAMVTGFLGQPGFPPEHPQFAGAALRYHFMTNYHAAVLARLGVDPIGAVQCMQVLNALALALLLGAVFDALTRRPAAAFLGVTLLLISRNAAWNVVLYAFGRPPDDLPVSGIAVGSLEFVRRVLLHNYFNFDDALSNLFHPQRPMLFGAGIGFGILLLCRKAWLEPDSRGRRWTVASLLLGSLVLFHLHTAVVIGLLHVALVLFSPAEGRRRMACLAPLMIAVPQIVFLLAAPRPDFFAGFDVARNEAISQIPVLGSLVLTRAFFWMRAGGIALTLGAVWGAAIVARRKLYRPSSWSRLDPESRLLLVLFGVGLLCFLGINVYRSTPNWGDSNKFYFYFTVPMCLLAGGFLAWLWDRRAAGRVLVALILVVFSWGPSLVDGASACGPAIRRLFRADAAAPGQRVLFRAEEFAVADWVRAATPPDAVFLTASTEEHFLAALAGRRVRCGAYVWQNGLADHQTIGEIQELYRDPSPERLLRYPVDYILVSFRERSHVELDEEALSRFPVVLRIDAPQGPYVVYRTDVAHIGSGWTGVPLRNLPWLAADCPEGAPAWGASPDTGAPFSCGGETSPGALGLHAPCRVQYEIGSYRFFVARVGVDDSQAGCPASAVFRVAVDAEERYASPVLRPGVGPWPVWVDLRGGRTLELEVDDAGDGNRCDHGVWLDPRLLVAAPPAGAR